MSTATVLDPAAATDYYIDAPAPGLYRDVPYDTYARWSALRSSLLNKVGQSPLHARYAMLHPGEDGSTKAKEFGHVLHHAVLEPDLFLTRYAKAPTGDKRLKDVKAAWAECQEKNAGKVLVGGDDFDQCIAMRDAVWSHPTAKEILGSPGAKELSAVWRDKETGLPCKGRQDFFGSWAGWPTLADLKSTVDASRKAFSRAISAYQYAPQGAYYLDGFDTLSPFEGDRRYVLIAVEKDPPFAVCVYELDQDSIAAGRRRYRSHLDQWARCLDSGLWVGYGDGCEAISLPAWELKEQEHY